MQVRESVSLQPAAVPRLTVRSPPPLSRRANLLRHGVGVDVVARLLTHGSSTTTSQTYIHLDVDDLRAELTRAGAWTAEEPR